MAHRSLADAEAEASASASAAATWHSRSSCSTSPMHRWFAADVIPPDVRAELRAICGSCPVLAQCREYAGQARPRAGFWAGRHRGAKTPVDIRDNPALCPVDAQGRAMPLVVVTSPVLVPDVSEVASAVRSERVASVVVPAGMSPVVPGAVELVVARERDLGEAVTMASASGNEVVLVGFVDAAAVPGASVLGDGYVPGDIHGVALAARRAAEGVRR